MVDFLETLWGRNFDIIIALALVILGIVGIRVIMPRNGFSTILLIFVCFAMLFGVAGFVFWFFGQKFTAVVGGG